MRTWERREEKGEQTALSAYVVFVLSSGARPPAKQQIEMTFVFLLVEQVDDFKKEKEKKKKKHI